MTYTDIRDITSFKWATVVGTSPLSIKLDGDTAPLALIPDSLVDPLSLVPGDRVRTELSLRKVVVHGVAKGGPERGSESLRNSRYGVPADNAARVSLANRRPLWYNTDRGWLESYYATTGLLGLTGGLMAGAPSGWYPVGPGPFIRLRPTAIYAASTSNAIKNWNGEVHRQGGSDWFTYDNATGRILVKKPGRYQVQVWTLQTSGTGVSNHHVRFLESGVVDIIADGISTPLINTLLTKVEAHLEHVLLGNREVELYTHSGNIDVHSQGSYPTIRGEFNVRYLGPALVAD